MALAFYTRFLLWKIFITVSNLGKVNRSSRFLSKFNQTFRTFYDSAITGFLYLLAIIICLYIYLACLSKFVWLFVFNKRQTVEPIRPKHFVEPHRTPEQVYGGSKFKKIASNKIRFSLNFENHELFW